MKEIEEFKTAIIARLKLTPGITGDRLARALGQFPRQPQVGFLRALEALLNEGEVIEHQRKFYSPKKQKMVELDEHPRYYLKETQLPTIPTVSLPVNEEMSTFVMGNTIGYSSKQHNVCRVIDQMASEGGFEPITYERVAARAGVTRQMVYKTSALIARVQAAELARIQSIPIPKRIELALEELPKLGAFTLRDVLNHARISEKVLKESGMGDRVRTAAKKSQQRKSA